MNTYSLRFTTCRRCGKRIVMIRADNGRTIPCDPETVRFVPGGGPETFVTETGRLMHGERAQNGPETGFRKHRKDCS